MRALGLEPSNDELENMITEVDGSGKYCAHSSRFLSTNFLDWTYVGLVQPFRNCVFVLAAALSCSRTLRLFLFYFYFQIVVSLSLFLSLPLVRAPLMLFADPIHPFRLPHLLCVLASCLFHWRTIVVYGLPAICSAIRGQQVRGPLTSPSS